MRYSVILPEGQVPAVQKRTSFCQQSQLGCQVILQKAKMKTAKLTINRELLTLNQKNMSNEKPEPVSQKLRNDPRARVN